MHDVIDIVKNIEGIYESDTAFSVLKDFERVLDELDLYVYENWEDGELVSGPNIERHWVTCEFMWPRDKMPDPSGGKRLVDYDCKVSYEKGSVHSLSRTQSLAPIPSIVLSIVPKLPGSLTFSRATMRL